MEPALPAPVRRELALAWLLHVAVAGGIAAALGWGVEFVTGTAIVMGVALVIVAHGFAHAFAAAAPQHPAHFGPANRVTLLRLSLGMLLAGVLFGPVEASLAGPPDDGGAVPAALIWAIVAGATLAALLDAVDGALARRSRTVSAFGARFDMETDAWLTLVLSVLAWQLDRAGAWVLLAGVMRYAFVAAAWVWPWLAAPLPGSRRRQVVCVAQIALLIAALAPVWSRAVSAALCAGALVLVAASFGADLRWLARSRAAAKAAGPAAQMRPVQRLGPWLLRFAAAAFVLNSLLTFESRFDAAGVHWSPRLSFELVVGALVALAWATWRTAAARLRTRAMWVLALACTALVLARYVDVTVPAFFGRPVNLVWDAPHVGQLLALAWAAWPAAVVIGVALAVLLGLAALTLAARWALAVFAASLRWRPARPWIAGVGALLCVSFAADPFVAADTRWFFSLPVTPMLARQARLAANVLVRPRVESRLTPSPDFAVANIDALRGADVLLLFVESYGISTFEQRSLAAGLAAPRAQLLAALQRGGREVVSARLRSPTFGGGSWLAHAALLAGVDTHEPDDYELLLSTRRPTLVDHFARHGWRTVGWMPGLQRPWPEGRFYGFDRYADVHAIGYRGPVFGYWRVPDQASLALLHAQELGATPPAGLTRRPRFVVFPTLATHAPFHPLAPYQPDWARLLTSEAWTTQQVQDALSPAQRVAGERGYMRALALTLRWLGEYLDGEPNEAGTPRASAALLTIIVGDHQPLAALAGRGASWDVPVHVVTGDAALLARLRAAGFTSGLEPGPRSLGALHELTPLLVRALHTPRVDVAGAGAGR